LGDLALHDARQYSCYTNKARTDFHKLFEMKPEKKQKTIEKYVGSYFITTNTKKLTIDTTIIGPNALRELNTEL
jgi:hypothetical protein